MNRSVIFRFIDNGKLNMIKALYAGKRFNIIPMYYSNDLDTFLILKVNNEYCLLLNSEYENTKSEDEVNIKINYALLNSIIKNEAAIDLINAYWYGFDSTIEVIKSLENIDDRQKDIRIKHLTTLVSNNQDVKVPNKENLLGSLNYIEVE